MPQPFRSVLEEIRRDEKLGGEVRHALHLPAQPSRYADPDPPLPGPLARALALGGVDRLWTHQAEGLAAAREGENVLVTTPTASGKSLVFHLPVLEEALRGDPGRALFLFPLKALGQDQRGKFRQLATAAGLAEEAAGCEIYDGDTPTARREKIRKRFPRVIVSNPDMLHAAILGYWAGWVPFLRELRWVVLDELHTYRGIFGSHLHHTLQRFLRLCREEGASPALIASSATAANAGEFAETLTGRPFRWIQESGAPREGRHFLLLQPEASPYTTALRLFLLCVKSGLKTIAFTKARRITELLYSWLAEQEPALRDRVASYRAGFLPEERRKIEKDLFEGRLDGVISTSALEMGIDVGGLDACILVGYPGSVIATWQRSGRVGRSGRESLTALVALPDALDQYFLQHPEEFLGRPFERLVLDPANEPVTRAHLVCAAAEKALRREEDRDYLERHAALVGSLIREHRLVESADGKEVYSLRRRPQRDVSLRGTGETFAILHGSSGEVVGTIGGVRVLFECHPGAVYLHAGRQYLVRELDREERKVHVVPARLDYFTSPLTEKETEVLEVLRERTDGPLRAWLGRVKVTERVVGYERKRIHTQERIDQHPLDLPPVHFETIGLWWSVPSPFEEAVRREGEDFMGSLHASEHAAISLFPILALCDRNDIGGISYTLHPQVKTGAVFLYDGYPGGIGIAKRGFEELPQLLGRVLALLEGCPCERGCPSCVQSPKCGHGNRPLDKAGAARLLRLLLGKEEAREAGRPDGAGAGEEAPGREALRRETPRREALPPEVASREAPERRITRERRAPKEGQAPKGGQAPKEVRAPGEGRAPKDGRAAREGRRRTPREKRTVLFDLETLRSAADVGGWENAHRMGLAVGVVLFLEEGRFEVFREQDARALAEALRSADLVVGFNIKRFDYRVLSGYTGEDYARTLPTFDLLEDIHGRLGFRLGLGHLAKETLGTGKSADGLQSLEWVKEGRMDLVEDYCRRDVEVLRDLYLFGRRTGYVLYRDLEGRQVKLPVEW